MKTATIEYACNAKDEAMRQRLLENVAFALSELSDEHHDILQACFCVKDGKAWKCVGAAEMQAESIKAAFDILKADGYKPDATSRIFIFPYVTAKDCKNATAGGTNNAKAVYSIAEYACWKDLQFRLRNDKAVEYVWKENASYREQFRQAAAAAVCAALEEKPDATMFDVYKFARNALKAEHKGERHESTTGKKYDANWKEHNNKPFYVIVPFESCPEMAELLQKAIENCDFTDKQADYIHFYSNGIKQAQTCKELGISKSTYYKAKNGCFYRILVEMCKIDGEGIPTLEKYGHTREKVNAALVSYHNLAQRKSAIFQV